MIEKETNTSLALAERPRSANTIVKRPFVESSSILKTDKRAHSEKHDRLREMSSKPTFLDDGALATSRKIGGALTKAVKETGAGTSEVIKNFAGQFKNALAALTSDKPSSKKIEAFRVPLMGVLTAVFSFFTAKSGMGLASSLFAKGNTSSQSIWKALQTFVNGTMAVGLFRTLSGKGKAFAKMSSMIVGAAVCFVVTTMNNIFADKGSVNNAMKNLAGEESVGIIRRFMNFFSLNRHGVESSGSVGDIVNSKSLLANPQNAQMANGADQAVDSAASQANGNYGSGFLRNIFGS